MSLTFGFYNSVGGDRKYDAAQMSAIFDGIINDGVFASVGGALAVTATTGMSIKVAPGRAWFNHTWTNSDVDMIMTLDAAGVGLSRIDAIVLEVNSLANVRANSIKILKGTPSSSPVAPTLTKNADVNQYPLAYIAVAAGTSSITQANITNKIGSSDCPFVTGILSVINTDILLAQWESEFTAWFDNLAGILDTNVAANLLNKITALENVVNDLSTDLNGDIIIIKNRVDTVETSVSYINPAAALYMYKNIGGSF